MCWRCKRFVIVQPSYYGTDNSCMLDALSAAGARARGVAMVGENCTDETLNAMHLRGVRALRLDLFPAFELADGRHHRLHRTQHPAHAGNRLACFKFYTPGWVVRDLLPFLAGLNADFVIDHMGYMLESDGLTHADFDRLNRRDSRGGTGMDQAVGPVSLKPTDFDA